MTLLIRDRGCTRCSLSDNAQSVCMLGTGPAPCKIMVIGEAPGKTEDEEDEPFVGKAGHYLNEILEDVGFEREKLFICNAVSCRPPENKTPSKKQIDACNHWLSYQIRKVSPKFVLLLGNTALQAITGEKGIKAARGKPFEKDGILYLPAFHPSYILRGDKADDPIFRKDLKLFKSLIEGGGIPEEERLSIKRVKDEASFNKMLDELEDDVSFDIETTGLYPWAKKNLEALPKKWKKDPPDPRSYDAAVTSIGFGTEKHQWVWLTDQFQVTRERLLKVIEKLEECTVIGHYSKFDVLWMLVHYKVTIPIDFDTGLAHYILDENSDHGLKILAQRKCDAPDWDIDSDTKRGMNSKEKLVKYHAHDLFYTRELKPIFAKELAEDPQVRRVFKKILMPCLQIFAEAECEGPYIDLLRMDEVEKELKRRIKKSEAKLKKWEPRRGEDDEPFNWGSTQQVAKLLYKKLKINCPQKTKGGGDSTSESTLKQIEHPIVKDLLELRGAKQQLSFFIEGWKPYLVGARLHPSFNLTGTTTGRLSSNQPNLQQVPTDELIRTLIIAPPGWVLIDADLSQIEMRIAAEVSGDSALIEAFNAGKDVHWIMALEELRRGGGEKERIIKTAKRLTNHPVDSYDDAIDILLEKGFEAAVKIDKEWKDLRKKAKACIAEGSSVLTNNGLKPIETVALSDLVWDGVEWVRHEGVVYRGYQEVITYDGCTATPDHKVFDTIGRTIQIGELASEVAGPGIAVTAIAENAVRYTYDPEQKNHRIKIPASNSILPSLQRDASTTCRCNTFKKDNQLSLSTVSEAWRYERLSVRKQEGNNSRGALRCYYTALQQSALRMVSTIWRARDTLFVPEPNAVYLLDAQESSARNLQRGSDRSEEQRQALCAGKSSSRIADGKSTKQTKQRKSYISQTVGKRCGSMAFVKNGLSKFRSITKSNNEACSSRNTNKRNSTEEGTALSRRKAHVYDIVNAGPRHRFTVSGRLVANCNFGFLFGMWWKKFKIYARDEYDIILTDRQAQDSRKSFFGTWRHLEKWQNRNKRFANRHGYVRSLSGRKRRLPAAMMEEDGFERQEAERQSVNSPVQSFANDWNLMALIQLKKEFSSKFYRPIATIHDSILAYVRIDHVEQVAKRTLEIMRRPELVDEFEIEMQVPIEADIKIGPWGAGISLKDWLKEQKKK